MLTSIFAGLRAGETDLIMGTSPPIFQGLSAWIIAVLRRKPFLMEIRDLWPEFAIDIGVLKNPVLIWLARRLENFLYARADHLLVNSPAYRDYLINKGVPAAKVTLIPNGVDPEMFDPHLDASAARTELGIHDKFVVMYAGALGIANDLSTILRAAKRLQPEPGICFLIMGDGAERAHLEQEAQELGLTNLYFLGSRPKSEVPAALAMADACIATLKNIPMFTTTYPNKIFDYMAAGKPIVLGIDGVIRRVVEAAEAGIFAAPGDDEAIANAILHLYRNQEAARLMGANGRAHVEAHFNRHKHSDDFQKLIKRVSERH
jgi:glycosyltransferase involved in cell wall biosynthesis